MNHPKTVLALLLVLTAVAVAFPSSESPLHLMAPLVIQKTDYIVVAVLRDSSCVVLREYEHCIGALDVKTVLYPAFDSSDQFLVRWTFDRSRQSPVNKDSVQGKEAIWLLSATSDRQTVTVFDRRSVYGLHQIDELEALVFEAGRTSGDQAYLLRIEALREFSRNTPRHN